MDSRFTAKLKPMISKSSSHKKAFAQTCSVKKVFFEISQNSQENTCARVSFLIKLQAPPATLLKKRLWHSCFPVSFAKFLRTPFLTEHLRRLLLYSYYITILEGSLCEKIRKISYIYGLFTWTKNIRKKVFQKKTAKLIFADTKNVRKQVFTNSKIALRTYEVNIHIRKICS